MSPNTDPALGPYCLFDPATGIGCGGDWCVEGTVEGAYVSGIELAARVGTSPIMFNEGQVRCQIYEFSFSCYRMGALCL